MPDFAFLHGGAQGSWVWDETVTAIALQSGGAGPRCLALDVPGCGAKRDRATGAIQPDDIVAELLDDIAAAGLEDVILVGHSQAGTILPRMAASRPAGFRHIVFVSCLAPHAAQTALTWREEMVAIGRSKLTEGTPQEPRERFRALFCSDMPAAEADRFLDRLGHDHWPAASYAMTGWDYDHLARMPSSYVLCLGDATLAPEMQAVFADRLHCRDIVRIDAGHQVMNTRPHALAEALLALARASAPI